MESKTYVFTYYGYSNTWSDKKKYIFYNIYKLLG